MDIDNIIDSYFGSSEAIWSAIKKFALIGSREATQMMLQMYYCLKSPTTPSLDKVIIVAGLGYQLLPKDVLPVEKYRILGLLDNGITLAIAYNKVQNNITPEITNQVNAIINQWFSVMSSSFTPPHEMPDIPSFPNVVPPNRKTAGGADDDDDLIVD